MFSPSVFLNSLLFKKLTKPVFRSIVYGYMPQRSPFDKTSYIEKYIPRPTKYHESRKPKLSQWTDPNVEWPLLLPPPTKLQGKALIKSIEKVERQRIAKNRVFKVAAVRPGDVIQFKYYLSLSEKKFNVYTGVVLGTKFPNSLEATIRVLFRFCGSLIEMNLKKYSPHLFEFKVVAKGRVRKAKIYKLKALGLSQNQLMKPVVRPKKTDKKKEKRQKLVKIQNNNVVQDRIDDPVLKSLELSRKEEAENKPQK